MSGQRISVVVPVRNAEPTIGRTLEALFRSTRKPQEVVVVDDGCTDGTMEIVARYPCRVVRSPDPGGVAAARNAGAAATGGEILFFTDADVELAEGALQAASTAMEDPRVSVAVGLQSARSAFPNAASVYKNLWLHHTYKVRAKSVSVLYSSAVAIRRSVFDAVGGFDVNYRRPNIEDSELGKRITEAGHKISIVPDIAFLHIKRYTLRGMVRTDFLRTVGMTKVQLRDRFRRIAKENYTSIPTSFLVSCAAPWVWVLLAAGGGGGGGPLLLSIVFVLVLNFRWLRFLAAAEGPLFLFPSAFFLLLDVLAVNAGILYGLLDYARGHRY